MHTITVAIALKYFDDSYRNILLCGSMDRLSFIVDLDRDEQIVVQKFQDHAKYINNQRVAMILSHFNVLFHQPGMW